MSPKKNNLKLSKETKDIDFFMRRIYERCKSKLNLHNIASHNIGNMYGQYLRNQDIAKSSSKKLPYTIWVILSSIFNENMSIIIGSIIYTLFGIPRLIFYSLSEKKNLFTFNGEIKDGIIFINTGKSNEDLIKKWIYKKFDEKILELERSYDEKINLLNIYKIPKFFKIYILNAIETIKDIIYLKKELSLNNQKLKYLMPQWFVNIQRESLWVIRHYSWSKLYLKEYKIKKAYITFNGSVELGFMKGLKNANFNYIEHGYPIRNIVPLNCNQIVYSKMHKDYINFFDPSIKVDIIKNQYFPKGKINPKRSIVIASMEDKDFFKIEEVSENIKNLLIFAKQNSWSIILRKRNYGSDDFEKKIDFKFDDISYSSLESFDECLKKYEPTMLWTTWSTALLHAKSYKVIPIAFVKNSINDYCVCDLESISYVVFNNQRLHKLKNALKINDPDYFQIIKTSLQI